MSEPNVGTELRKLPTARRRAVSLSPQGLVKIAPLREDGPLPLVVEAAVSDASLTAWAEQSRELVERLLPEHGAILFRNFKVNSVADFEQFIKALGHEPLEYRERSSPRSQLGEHVYTSTDYPEEQSIFPHNEHSYSRRFPSKLFFCCLTAAREGGETPLCDTRRVMARISRPVRERFIEKGWMLVRNYGHGLGLPWQTVFQTEDRAVVDGYCRRADIETEWLDGDRLRTRQVRPAVIKHPRTGELTWFNHATFFHASTLEPAIRDTLLAEFKEEDLPNHTYYGDGTRIEATVAEELRAAYTAEAVKFPWQVGCVVLLDNVLTAHARSPFKGPRKILFAMADPYLRSDF